MVSSGVHAERKDVTGDVGVIRYHVDSGTMAPSWSKGVWFQLLNPSEPLCTDNKISIAPSNETAISMLLAAKMANKQIEVTVDDAVKYPANTYCSLQYITIK